MKDEPIVVIILQLYTLFKCQITLYTVHLKLMSCKLYINLIRVKEEYIFWIKENREFATKRSAPQEMLKKAL